MLHQSSAKTSADKTLAIIILAISVVVASITTPLAFAQGVDPPPIEEPADSGGDVGTADTGTGGSGEDGADAPDGEPGEPADNASGETPPEDPNTIETGDATASGEVGNNVNTNITNPAADGESGDNEGSTEGGREETVPRTRQGGDDELEVVNNNDAVVENELEVVAETGENTMESSGNGVIETGDAVAFANVINAVNTNIFNSSGFFLFLNNFFDFESDLDLRNVDWLDPPGGAPQGQGCGLYDCHLVKNLTLQNNNTVALTNSVVVRASTGGNSISGDGSINTGNAYAAANVVNLVNTNIVDSNYLLLSFNNFGDWVGDIVFPAQNFFENIFGGIGNSRACNSSGVTTVTNNNNAEVTNEVTVGANTGENTIEGDASSTSEAGEIETGDAVANVAITNQINTNLFCNTSFSIIFRIHGNWAGNVFSAPEGVYWRETSDGIELFSQPPVVGGDTQDAGRGNNRTRGGTSVDIENNNNANIRNNVEVLALTGKNRIAGGGSINTGNAQAAANIFNIVNTNIVGKNWLVAVINIFGDWDGNIAFGRPNLWVGASASVPQNPASPGDIITYTLTVLNNGDTNATDVTLRDSFDNTLLALSGGSYDEAEDGQVLWNLGTIPPGGSAEVSYQATVDSGIPVGESNITNTSEVSSLEDDEDYEDNSDIVTVLAFKEVPANSGGGSSGSSGGGGGGAYPRSFSDPRLTLTKSNSADDEIAPGDSVDYTIVLENEGYGYALNAKLIDTLVNEDGEVIHEEMWDLGKIFNDEEITITYTTVFNENAAEGLYTNTAQVFADREYESPIAISVVEVAGVAEVIEQADELPDVVITSSESGNGEEVLGEESPEFSVGNLEETTFLASIITLFPGYFTLHSMLALIALVLVLILLRKGDFFEES